MTGSRLLLAAWLVCSFADGVRLGTYTHTALALMSLGVVLVSVPVLLPARFPITVPTRTDLAVTLVAIACLYGPGTIVPANRPSLGEPPLLVLTGLVVGVVLLLLGQRLLGAGLVLLMAAAAGLLIIKRDTPPGIDVWYLTQYAADSVVQGASMYLGHYPDSHGVRDGFPYLPGVGLLLAPFRLVGLDVRHGLLLFALASSVIVWRCAPRSAGPWLAAMVLVVPSWPTLIAYAWTEPLLLLALVAAFVLVRSGHLTWAAVALGVALASKQHVFLLIPLLAAWPAFGWRRTAAATVGAGLVVLPWFLATPGAFLDGALYLNLDLEPRPDSLSLFTLATEQGWRPPFALVGALTLVAIGVSVVVLRRGATPALAALHCSWVLAVFHLMNKQSFYNEWWLVIGLLVVSLSLAEPEREVEPAPA